MEILLEEDFIFISLSPMPLLFSIRQHHGVKAFYHSPSSSSSSSAAVFVCMFVVDEFPSLKQRTAMQFQWIQ